MESGKRTNIISSIEMQAARSRMELKIGTRMKPGMTIKMLDPFRPQ